MYHCFVVLSWIATHFLFRCLSNDSHFVHCVALESYARNYVRSRRRHAPKSSKISRTRCVDASQAAAPEHQGAYNVFATCSALSGLWGSSWVGCTRPFTILVPEGCADGPTEYIVFCFLYVCMCFTCFFVCDLGDLSFCHWGSLACGLKILSPGPSEYYSV